MIIEKIEDLLGLRFKSKTTSWDNIYKVINKNGVYYANLEGTKNIYNINFDSYKKCFEKGTFCLVIFKPCNSSYVRLLKLFKNDI